MLKKICLPDTFALLISAALFGLYASMLSGRLSGANHAGDGGDLLAAMLTGGIPHPTGYPTYMILGRLFQLLPIGSPYFRGSLFSAASAALATGLIFLWVKSETGQFGWLGVLAGSAAAVLLGVSPLFWSQAVIVEVYALEMFFLALALWWFHFLAYYKPSKRVKILVSILSIGLGLAVGDHVTILLLAPVCGYAVYLGWKRGVEKKFLAAQAGFVLTGLMVYLYLPLQAHNYPPINWGNPQNWQGFIWELSGRPYQGLVFDLPWPQLSERVSAWARLLVDQFGIVGLLFGLLGLVQAELINKPTRFVLGWIFVIYTFFSLGYNTADSMVYLLPAFLVFAVWIGLGVLSILQIKWRQYPVGVIIAAGLAVSIVIRTPSIYVQIDPRRDASPANYAEKYLQTMPENALVLTSADDDTFPLWYFHFGLGWRSDVRVIVLPLTQFEWYQVTIQHVYPDLVVDPISDGAENWGEDLVKLNPERPVCRSTLDNQAEYGVAVTCSTKTNPSFFPLKQ